MSMIGVIADDLTGAAELAALGLRHGLRAEIVLSGPASGRADLVCVDTDSRACDAAEAGRRVAAAAQLLLNSKADWIYKKVDSVLRGQVTAEIEALLQCLGRQAALLVPANPSLGRTIRDGKYFIRDLPIDQTEFARDPTYPRRSANVLELLAPAATGCLGLRKPGEPLPATGVVLGEAQSAEHLRQWARQSAPHLLLGGGAEFFGACLTAAGHAEQLPLAAPAHAAPATGGELFISGSTSLAARAFVRSAHANGAPVFPLPGELARGGAFAPQRLASLTRQVAAAIRSHRRVILHIGLPPVRERAAAEALTTHLVTLAEAVLREADVERVCAEGGATAVELVRRMGWARLTVERELAPGVASLSVQDAKPVQLIIKPGSYVWPEELRRGFGLQP